jgi:hypothetical protein
LITEIRLLPVAVYFASQSTKNSMNKISRQIKNRRQEKGIEKWEEVRREGFGTNIMERDKTGVALTPARR